MQPRQGYCMSCRTTRELTDTKQIDRAGGPAIEGKCAVCGTTVFVLGAGSSIRTNGAPTE